MIETRIWHDMTEADLREWGNDEVKVIDAEGREAWKGLACGWSEQPTGSLQLDRGVLIAEGVMVRTPFLLIASGQWASVVPRSFLFDPDVIRENQEQQQIAAQARAQMAAQMQSPLAVPNLAVPRPMNREQRRNGQR